MKVYVPECAKTIRNKEAVLVEAIRFGLKFTNDIHYKKL